MKEAAYKGMVRPALEYGSSVWDPHYDGLNDKLEKVQWGACWSVVYRCVNKTKTKRKGTFLSWAVRSAAHHLG